MACVISIQSFRRLSSNACLARYTRPTRPAATVGFTGERAPGSSRTGTGSLEGLSSDTLITPGSPSLCNRLCNRRLDRHEQLARLSITVPVDWFLSRRAARFLNYAASYRFPFHRPRKPFNLLRNSPPPRVQLRSTWAYDIGTKSDQARKKGTEGVI